RVHVGCGFSWRSARRYFSRVQNIHNVIALLVQLSLSKIGKQALVAAMSVYDYDFSTAIAGHLVGSLLQKRELDLWTVRHRPRLMPGFEDLAEIIFRENKRVLLLRRMQGNLANIDQVIAQRQVRAIFFQDSDGQNANALGLLYAGA